jgi:hypothetical protein
MTGHIVGTARQRATRGAYAVAMLVGIVVTSRANAQTFTTAFKGSSGQTEQASAVFNLTNGTLTLVLSNTSVFATYTNPDVLSGVFFAIAGSPILTPISAAASTAATCTSNACVSGDVSKNYAYVYSASGFTQNSSAFASGAYGVGAPGYGTLSPSFGHSASSFSPGTAHATGQGLSYSIVGPDYLSGGNGPFVQNSVTFEWSVPNGVTSLAISNVKFTYGTNPDGSNLAQVPEPSSLAFLGMGVVGLVRLQRKRRNCPGDRTVPRSSKRCH